MIALGALDQLLGNLFLWIWYLLLGVLFLGILAIALLMSFETDPAFDDRPASRRRARSKTTTTNSAAGHGYEIVRPSETGRGTPNHPDTIVVGEAEAVGFVVDGQREALYGPGRHYVGNVGRYSVRTEDRVRFPTDETVIPWNETYNNAGVGDTGSTITVEVTDPEQLWAETPDPHRPIRAALEQIATEHTDDGWTLTGQTARECAGYTSDYGIETVSIEQTVRKTYELETLAGELVEIDVAMDRQVGDEGTLAERSEQLRERLRLLLAELLETEQSLAAIDVATIDGQVREQLTIERIEIVEQEQNRP
jgi:Arc/MetJ-type ribon-helix-helix transcriptional regulator